MAKLAQLVTLGRGCQTALLEGFWEGCPLIPLWGSVTLWLSSWAFAWPTVSRPLQYLCLAHLSRPRHILHADIPAWLSQRCVWPCFPSPGLTPTHRLMSQPSFIPSPGRCPLPRLGPPLVALRPALLPGCNGGMGPVCPGGIHTTPHIWPLGSHRPHCALTLRMICHCSSMISALTWKPFISLMQKK